MSIISTIKKLNADGYDANKDNINGFTRIPAGEYVVQLNEADYDANEKTGRVSVIVKLVVSSGEYADRTETIFLSFDDGLPEFVQEKNTKMLMKLVSVAEIKSKESDYEDEQTVAEMLRRGLGKQFKMELTVQENKKNPQYPYRNYEFSKITDENPFETDIEDEEMPF